MQQRTAVPTFHDTIVVTLVPWQGLTKGNYAKFIGWMGGVMGPGVRMIVDLRQVNTVDGWGVRALVELSRNAEQAGGQIKYCGMTRQVRTLLETVRFHRVCDLYNDHEEAMRAYRG